MTRLLAVVCLALFAAVGVALGERWELPRGLPKFDRPLADPAPGNRFREVALDYLRATNSRLHDREAMARAKDEECLACHRETITDRVRETSPAGLLASESKAWYQLLATYDGPQETFHRRHLVTSFSKEVMRLRCNTCHQGHDSREEAPGSSANAPAPGSRPGYTLRKQVDPEATCLSCHGQMNLAAMGLPGPWPEIKATFGNSCLTCHTGIRSVRHQVDYLNPEAIERLGAANSDVCYGCHGGRAWYRLSYPYPRHPWPNMPADTPDWAKDRPTTSEARFLRK